MSAKRIDTHDDKLPIRMLHDRVLVRQENGEGERRSGGGILIPATAAVGQPAGLGRGRGGGAERADGGAG